jgi:hypothetical protein
MSAMEPRSSVVHARVGSFTCGVTSTMTARRTRSGRVAARRMVVAPPSDMPTTPYARGASCSIAAATATALCHGL